MRDLDTVAGEDSTAVDNSADSPSIVDVDSVYSNTVVIGYDLMHLVDIVHLTLVDDDTEDTNYVIYSFDSTDDCKD